MSNDLIKFDFNFLDINTNEEEREEIILMAIKMAQEAIISNSFENINKSFKNSKIYFEKWYNLLDVENEKNKKVYDFGRISSIFYLITYIEETRKQQEENFNVANRYKLLFPILDYVKRNRKVTGKQIKTQLNLSSDSNVTQFFTRIKSLSLFYIQKVGNTNYYSLTPKGENAYSSIKMLKNDIKMEINSSNSTEDIIIKLFSTISEQMLKEYPSVSEVLKVLIKNNVEVNNKMTINKSIKNIFTNRDSYIRTYIRLYLESINESERSLLFNNLTNTNYYIQFVAEENKDDTEYFEKIYNASMEE